MTSYRCFKMAAIELEIYFGFGFSDGTRLRRWKSASIPNFDVISQCTAEINATLVSENRGPSYQNSTSGFDFGLIFVIGVSFCIGLPKCVKIVKI